MTQHYNDLKNEKILYFTVIKDRGDDELIIQTKNYTVNITGGKHATGDILQIIITKNVQKMLVHKHAEFTATQDPRDNSRWIIDRDSLLIGIFDQTSNFFTPSQVTLYALTAMDLIHLFLLINLIQPQTVEL